MRDDVHRETALRVAVGKSVEVTSMGFVFHRARAAAAGVLAGGALAAAISAPGCASDDANTVKSVCPPGQTCQARLTLLHSSDIHSRLFPYDLVITQVDSELGLGANGTVANVGGVSRMAYVIGRERARADRVLHLDSGDIWEGAPIFNFFSGEPEVRAAAALGIDAMVIGNHEFDRGAINVATQFQRWASFPVLAANYKFYDVNDPASTRMSTLLSPVKVFNVEGLKVAVIGMGNLSTLGSIFNQPNSLGMIPLDTVEVAQFYVDLMRPYVDFVVMLTHLGLDVDQRMVRNTTGIDVVLGGHNHIVINPPQKIQDCTADTFNPGFIWEVDPNYVFNEDPNATPPNDAAHPDPVNHPYQFMRKCNPRNVTICHSGAFSKYVGRLDLILSNDPKEVSPTGDPKDYDTNDGFEVVSSNYTPFPITAQIPTDPVMDDMLQPYRRTLDRVADLDILVGYSPNGAKRIAPQGGDSPLGNLIATAMWLRLGVQTDFSLTNTTGIRADLNPGPITIEEMFNIFPFDNSITKMQLSGLEVTELFDFVARRSEGRGCVSQSQIAGARVRINCAGCTRPDAIGACTYDTDCVGGAPGSCQHGQCNVPACAEQIFIGHRTCQQDSDCGVNVAPGICATAPGGSTGYCVCSQDSDCGNPSIPGVCDKPLTGAGGTCLSPIANENLYELATSNYLAGGGSGYRVLQRNTTQFDTQIQQRDALTDYMRQGKPCGYRAADNRPQGLAMCATDADCQNEGNFVCACAGFAHGTSDGQTTVCTTDAQGCADGTGLCVRRDCRDTVAQFHNGVCATSPDRAGCEGDLNSCSLAGEECKFLSCVDESIGNFTDNRMDMIGR